MKAWFRYVAGAGTYSGGTIFWRRAKEGGHMRNDSRMHASRYGSSWHSRSVAIGCVSRPAAAASWSSRRSLEQTCALVMIKRVVARRAVTVVSVPAMLWGC